MKLAALKTAAKTVVLICFTVFVVLPLFFSCAFVIQDWRYLRFGWRGQKYYARVAEACDQLLAQAEPIPREIRGDKLQSLPVVLRELNPDYVMIYTNVVFVRVGSGRIVWASEESNRSWWDLTTSGASPESHRLFSKMKPGTANRANALEGGILPPVPVWHLLPAVTNTQR
jgi:hypothetical protein